MKILGNPGTIAQSARRTLRTTVHGSVQGVGGSRTTRIVTARPNAYHQEAARGQLTPGQRRQRTV